jgi:hypothetical protein
MTITLDGVIYGAYPGLLVPGLTYPSEPIQAAPSQQTEGESVFTDHGWSLYHDVPFDWAGH